MRREEQRLMPKGIKDEFSKLPGRQKRYYHRHKEEAKTRAAKWQQDHKKIVIWICETCGKALPSRFIARQHTTLLDHNVIKQTHRSLLDIS